MSKSILFVTSLNLSSNPRLVKELRLAKQEGFGILVISFELGIWSDSNDDVIIKEINPIRHIKLCATRKYFLSWVWYSILEKFAKLMNLLISKSSLICSIAHSKRSYQIMRLLNQLKFDGNLIIAHNLPTLFPAMNFAKKRNISFAFDVEDFHPGEYIKGKYASNEKRRREILFNSCLKNAFYITYASPLIKSYTLNLISEQDSEKHLNLPNLFYSTDFNLSEKSNKSSIIQLVWFSQNINYGRGLEKILPFLDTFSSQLKLTLIGKMNPEFEQNEIKHRLHFVTLIPPQIQQSLHKSLSDFDIGLAIEDASTDLNKNLALSNKIIAYAQAGLYILASKTPAQQHFLDQSEILGKCFNNDFSNFGDVFSNIIHRIIEIRKFKQLRFEWSKENLDFEKKSEILTAKWKQV